jgi:uncharacterized protein (TIGR02118 family)
MMIKVIALLKKREGLTSEQFKEYYENHHVPLACRMLPMGRDYRRNYTLKMRANGRETNDAFVYDVVSETWFDDETAYQAFAQAMMNPETFAQVSGDEAKFLDRASCKYLIVEEHKTIRQT